MKKVYLSLILLVVVLSNISSATALTGTRLQDGVSDLHIKEDLTFETHYQTSKDFIKWQITNNKAIEIQLRLTSNPSNKIVLVTHMYAVIYIESRQEWYDDIEQDYMDDFIEGSTQGGFFVNSSYPYQETFSVKGLSDDFLTMLWYGARRDSNPAVPCSDYSPRRVSEGDLINNYHVVGQTLYIVFDILVKLPTEEFYHKFAVSDNIYIDLNGTVLVNQADIVDIVTENTEQNIPGYEPWLFVGLCIIVVTIIHKKIGKSPD